MSLLDRVNRNLPGATTAPSQPGTPAPPASPANGNGHANGSGAPAAPAPAPAQTAQPHPQQQRGADGATAARPAAAPLSARTGLNRHGIGKMSAIQTQYVELRGRVHQRLVEELVDTENNSHAPGV